MLLAGSVNTYSSWQLALIEDNKKNNIIENRIFKKLKGLASEQTPCY